MCILHHKRNTSNLLPHGYVNLYELKNHRRVRFRQTFYVVFEKCFCILPMRRQQNMLEWRFRSVSHVAPRALIISTHLLYMYTKRSMMILVQTPRSATRRSTVVNSFVCGLLPGVCYWIWIRTEWQARVWFECCGAVALAMWGWALSCWNEWFWWLMREILYNARSQTLDNVNKSFGVISPTFINLLNVDRSYSTVISYSTPNHDAWTAPCVSLYEQASA